MSPSLQHTQQPCVYIISANSQLYRQDPNKCEKSCRVIQIQFDD